MIDNPVNEVLKEPLGFTPRARVQIRPPLPNLVRGYNISCNILITLEKSCEASIIVLY